MQIFGVILAGGAGRRMGGADKALLMLAGQTLLAHVAARFAPQVAALALSANGDPARFAGRDGLPVLPDAAADGPLAGILAALDWAAAGGAAAVVSVPVDAPFLPPDLVPRLLLAGGGGLAVADSGRVHPVVALWPVTLRGALRAGLAQGNRRVMDFARAEGAATAHFPDARAFANLNTPADLAAAEAMLAAGAP